MNERGCLYRQPRFAYNLCMEIVDSKLKFLDERRNTIIEGLEHVDGSIFKPNLVHALSDIGYRVVILPDEEWTPSKWFPTETSKEDREVRVLHSYIAKNTGMLGYSDQCGWAFHELVHATIFSGHLPERFMALNSPFEYPLNTDEIYCYGYQVWKMAQLGKLKDFVKFVVKKVPYIGNDLNLLVKSICQTH